jgi:hypothetical protein
MPQGWRPLSLRSRAPHRCDRPHNCGPAPNGAHAGPPARRAAPRAPSHAAASRPGGPCPAPARGRARPPTHAPPAAPLLGQVEALQAVLALPPGDAAPSKIVDRFGRYPSLIERSVEGLEADMQALADLLAVELQVRG